MANTYGVRSYLPARRHRFAGVVVAAVTLALTGCGVLTKASASGSGDTAAGLPRFTARTISGATVSLPSQRRATVVLFFGVECGACGPEATTLAQVKASEPSAADYAAIDVAGETNDQIKTFLHDTNATNLPYISDTNGSLVAGYGITENTTVLIIDRHGRVLYRAVEPSAGAIRAELAKVTS